MARKHSYWGLAPSLNEAIEAWTATTNHTNEADSSVTANTAEAFTAGNIIWIPVDGNDFTVTMGVTQAATVGTVTFRIEGTSSPTPAASNVAVATIGSISHVVAAAATAEYEVKTFSGAGYTHVRLKDYQATSTGNLSAMNARFGVEIGPK